MPLNKETKPTIKGILLLTVDSFSKWPEIYRYKHPTAKNPIKALGAVFSRFGVPNTVVSDNGTMLSGKRIYGLLQFIGD